MALIEKLKANGIDPATLRPIAPTVNPAKTSEDILKAREKIKGFLSEADDFEGLAGGMQAGRYPTIQKPASVAEMRQSGNIQPGPLDELSEFVRPTGKVEEQRDMVPTGEDPRRAEYMFMAKKRRDQANTIAQKHGIDLKEFAPPPGKPEIKDDVKGIQSIEAPKPMTGPSSPSDTIESLMEANGVPEKDFNDSVSDLLAQFNKQNNTQLDLNSPMNFGVGLKSFLSLPGMEDVRTEFEGEAQKLIRGGTPEQNVSKEATKGTSLQARKDMEGTEEGQRLLLERDYKELGQEQPLRSAGAIIAYVLLSMVIGPGLARLFFQKSAKAGQLEREIGDRHDRIKRFQQEKDMEAARQVRHKEFMTQLAARSMMDRGEKAEDQQSRLKEKLFLMGVESLHQMKQRELEERKLMSKEAANASKKQVDDLEKTFSRNRAVNERLEHVITNPLSYAPEAIEKAKKQKELVDEEFFTLKELMDTLYGGNSTGPGEEAEGTPQ